MQIDHDRKHCTCGTPLKFFGTGANWGDWKCPACGVAWCQDCGSQINMWTMQCAAYEVAQSSESGT